jgi:hypothetical protein
VIDLSKIELKLKNAHDVEDVALCDFLRFFRNRISSALDVGAHYSHAHYAREVRSLISGYYDGIDLLPDPDTAPLLDNYHVANFSDAVLWNYDVIFSISALEHCGISTYKIEDYREERYQIASGMFRLAEQFVFMSFPFGLDGLVEDQYANITNLDLVNIERVALSSSFIPLVYDFYYNEHPQQGKPWERLTRQQASKIPLDPAIEQQTVAVCSWMRCNA